MAEELLRAGAAAHVIATSREPLRAAGEWIYPVLPRAVPAEDARDDDLPQYGAVRLFFERARAVEPHFAPDPRDAAAVAAICRRLDGVPLAIELAAARIGALSAEQLLAHLDDRFHLLSGGRRTALPRHQTLWATLDWSYELLIEPERVVLRRLAIFRRWFANKAVRIWQKWLPRRDRQSVVRWARLNENLKRHPLPPVRIVHPYAAVSGEFSLEAATAVAAPELTAPQVVQGLCDLVAKSLLVTEMGHIAHYRLLDTTRDYALEKLAESGESELLAHRHAEYYLDLFERAEAESDSRATAEWRDCARRRASLG
jgi:predicted ATPase